MVNSYFSPQELTEIGFRAIGTGVLISRYARFYSPCSIEIGNNVRIDDFCILSGTILIGDYVHISAYTALYGRFGIEIGAYSGLSPRCTVFSAVDDFSGDYLVGPMVSQKHTNVIGGRVLIGRFCQLGSGCVVFPNLVVSEGVAVGAMSLINKDLAEWKIYKGIPATVLKDRSKALLKLLL